jgi:hypothetical protein
MTWRHVSERPAKSPWNNRTRLSCSQQQSYIALRHAPDATEYQELGFREFGRPLDRKVGGLRAFENARDISDRASRP